MQPIRLPLFVNAQLGFMAVYLLADYDELARKLILAHHTALIDRSTLERWLNEGAHALRSLFSLAQQYRYSGCTRDDFAAKNAAARAPWRSTATAAGRARRNTPLPLRATHRPPLRPDPHDQRAGRWHRIRRARRCRGVGGQGRHEP